MWATISARSGITSGNNVSLTDADALNFAASTVSGTLTVTSNGALTQSGPLTVTAGNITLKSANTSSVGVTMPCVTAQRNHHLE